MEPFVILVNSIWMFAVGLDWQRSQCGLCRDMAWRIKPCLAFLRMFRPAFQFRQSFRNCDMFLATRLLGDLLPHAPRLRVGERANAVGMAFFDLLLVAHRCGGLPESQSEIFRLIRQGARPDRPKPCSLLQRLRPRSEQLAIDFNIPFHGGTEAPVAVEHENNQIHFAVAATTVPRQQPDRRGADDAVAIYDAVFKGRHVERRPQRDLHAIFLNGRKRIRRNAVATDRNGLQ